MQTMKLRAIQLPGNAGELLDSFIRVEGHLPGESHPCGTWVRVRNDSWQRCNE